MRCLCVLMASAAVRPDWEMFAVKIIHVLNFHVKNISPPDGSAM